MEWEIPCNRVEESFQLKNGLLEQVKIMSVEYDDLADAIYVEMDVDSADAATLPHVTEHSLVQDSLIEDLSEIA